jgi:hypothetical protein
MQQVTTSRFIFIYLVIFRCQMHASFNYLLSSSFSFIFIYIIMKKQKRKQLTHRIYKQVHRRKKWKDGYLVSDILS